MQFLYKFYQRVTSKPFNGKTSFQSHIVEQHKCYRMVVESWESMHPGEPKHTTFTRGTFRALANSMHKTVYRRAHGSFWVVGLEQKESR